MSSRLSPKSGIRLLPVSRKVWAAARAETEAGRATIAERGVMMLRDVAAGQLDGALEQLAGRVGELGLGVLGLAAVGGDLHLDARRAGRGVGVPDDPRRQGLDQAASPIVSGAGQGAEQAGRGPEASRTVSAKTRPTTPAST